MDSVNTIRSSALTWQNSTVTSATLTEMKQLERQLCWQESLLSFMAISFSWMSLTWAWTLDTDTAKYWQLSLSCSATQSSCTSHHFTITSLHHANYNTFSDMVMRCNLQHFLLSLHCHYTSCSFSTHHWCHCWQRSHGPLCSSILPLQTTISHRKKPSYATEPVPIL